MSDLLSASERMVESLGHVPRYLTRVQYDPVVSISRWASKNLPEELAVPTLAYIAKVCGPNSWPRSTAVDFIRKHLAALREHHESTAFGPTPGDFWMRLPTLVGTSGRSMGLMRDVANDSSNGDSRELVASWETLEGGSEAQREVNRNFITVLDDCIHTGHTAIKELISWKEALHPKPGFIVHLCCLSAHREGITAVQHWVQENGGVLSQTEGQNGIGKIIERFTVSEGLRFPWLVVPGSDFERAALEHSEIAEYLKSRRTVGRSLEDLTPEQVQLAQPNSDDLLGAIGLLMVSIHAYNRGVSKGGKTGGIRPMGYVQEWDPVRRHHELGFGSPFTSWFGVPNTAPLGLWSLVEAPSLFVRKRMDAPWQQTSSPTALPSDLDDLPF